MFKEKEFHTGELILNYAEGPDTGPPIVFLHGLSGSWPEYESILEHLSKFGRLYAPDLRGHGKSSRGNRYLLPDYGRDIIHFIHHWIGKPVLLVGHSLGALTALTVAAVLPDWVEGLILLDPPIMSRKISLNMVPEIKSWLEWVLFISWAKRPLSEIAKSLHMIYPDLNDETTIKIVNSVAALDPATVVVALKDQLLDEIDLDSTLAQVHAPTLLLYGDDQLGSTVRDQDAAYFQTQIPQARIAKISGAGHALYEEPLDQVWQHIEQFTTGLRQRVVRKMPTF